METKNIIQTLKTSVPLCLCVLMATACTNTDDHTPQPGLAPATITLAGIDGANTRTAAKTSFGPGDVITLTYNNATGAGLTANLTDPNNSGNFTADADIYLDLPNPGTVTATYNGNNGDPTGPDNITNYADHLAATATPGNGITYNGTGYNIALTFTHTRALVKLGTVTDSYYNRPLQIYKAIATLDNGTSITLDAGGHIAPEDRAIASVTITLTDGTTQITAYPAADVVLTAGQTTVLNISVDPIGNDRATVMATTIYNWVQGGVVEHTPTGYDIFIWEAADLEKLNNTNGFNGKKIIQMRDIDMDGITWTAIDVEDMRYNGNGYEIQNLKVTAGAGGNGGLFVGLDNCVLAGIHIRDCDISVSASAGALAAVPNGSTIALCSATGVVKSSGNNSGVGGLVGWSNGHNHITRCYADCKVQGKYAGGIIGASDPGDIIVACMTAGEITSSSDYAGGIVGHTTGTTLFGCCATTQISSSHMHKGGLAGYGNAGSTISNSYCTQPGFGYIGYDNGMIYEATCWKEGDTPADRNNKITAVGMNPPTVRTVIYDNGYKIADGSGYEERTFNPAEIFKADDTINYEYNGD